MENSTALSENFHDLLPPRKRLLLGLKHATAIPADTFSIHPSPPESLRIEVHVDAAHTAPPHSLLLCSPSQKCFTCADGGVLLHRVPYLAGSIGYHCSLCILEINKKMYCAFCYEVIETDSPSSSSSRFLTCCRCERLTHLDCALKLCSRLEEGDVYLCKDCHPRSNGKFMDAEVTVQEPQGVQQCKRPLISAGMVKFPLLDVKELVAARIVAITAKRAALKAKQKAVLLAKTAAHAAGHAKNVLDYMSKLSHMDLEDTSLNGKHTDEVRIVPHRTPKCSKKRALSSIVASEMSSKREGTVVNDMITPKYGENKHVGLNGRCDSAEAASPCDVGKEPGPSVTHKARLAAKRTKSLSLLGLQNSTRASPLKSPNLASKKIQKSGFLSKGNLGAIMSQFLASKKLSMRTIKAPFWKTKSGGSYCTALGVSSENGIKRKVHSMAVLALENGHSSDNIYSS